MKQNRIGTLIRYSEIVSEAYELCPEINDILFEIAMVTHLSQLNVNSDKGNYGLSLIIGRLTMVRDDLKRKGNRTQKEEDLLNLCGEGVTCLIDLKVKEYTGGYESESRVYDNVTEVYYDGEEGVIETQEISYKTIDDILKDQRSNNTTLAIYHGIKTVYERSKDKPG